MTTDDAQHEPAHPGPDALDLERRADARRLVRTLAEDAEQRGVPTAWFDELYVRAAGDPSSVPWANLVPHPLLVELLDRVAPAAGARTLVVGCGLGDDAAECARRGLDVTGFDLSETAIRWAQRRHPQLAERLVVEDLLGLPSDWERSFDLVVEVYTLQALPAELRAGAFAALARVLRPGGALLAVSRALDEGTPLDAPREGPPWPLAQQEFESWGAAGGLHRAHVERHAAPDPEQGFAKLALVLRRADGS